MSRVEDEYAINIDEDYLAGLLDYLSNPRLEIISRAGGFGFRGRKVQISVRQSEILCGIITQHLEELGINYNVSYTGEGEIRYIKVEGVSAVKNLDEWGDGRLLQIPKRLKYLMYISEEYGGTSFAAQPQRFLEVYKTWDDLNPEWNTTTGKKYTLEYVKSELGVEQVEDSEPIPEVEYPTELSTAYIAGLFDAQGKVRLNISKNNEYSIGYGMGLAMTIQISHPRTMVSPHLKKYFSSSDISPSFNTTGQTLSISLSNAAEIERFIEDVSPYIYYNYDSCQLFYEQLIPAYRDGYHHSKEGFLDIVRAYESAVDRGPSTKYDVKYFEDEWDTG